MFDCGEIRVAPKLINTLNPTTCLPLLEGESVALSFEGTSVMFRTCLHSCHHNQSHFDTFGGR
jgi:hypothetical protein